MLQLVIDHREKAVIPAIDMVFADAYICRTMALAVADYHICTNSATLACIERKTYQDFAASFLDGRYKNIQKMLDLRTEFGSKLFLFIEGPAFPSPDGKIGAIPIKSIMTALDDMIVRDDIHVIMTRDVVSTAENLLRLMQAFEKFKDLKDPAKDSKDPIKNPILDSFQLPPATLKKNEKKVFIDAMAEMWAQLPGISVIQGTLMASKYTVISFLRKEIVIDDIKNINGRKITKLARDSLNALSSHDNTIILKLLGGVPGISAARAKTLTISAAFLLSMKSTDLVSKMGKKISADIYRFINGVEITHCDSDEIDAVVAMLLETS